MKELGFVTQACDPSTQNAEEGTFRVQNQPGLLSKTLSKERKRGREGRSLIILCLEIYLFAGSLPDRKSNEDGCIQGRACAKELLL